MPSRTEGQSRSTTRYYTPRDADRALPLVRAIARDVQATAVEIRDTLEALERGPTPEGREQLMERFGELRDRFGELMTELEELGIELKDPLLGLLDFRARRGKEDVFLCWRLGEERVGHWHPIEGGYRARQPIETF